LPYQGFGKCRFAAPRLSRYQQSVIENVH
jgi:hypothetical protein